MDVWDFPTIRVQYLLRRSPDDALLSWYHVVGECKSLSIANGMQQHESHWCSHVHCSYSCSSTLCDGVLGGHNIVDRVSFASKLIFLLNNGPHVPTQIYIFAQASMIFRAPTWSSRSIFGAIYPQWPSKMECLFAKQLQHLKEKKLLDLMAFNDPQPS